MGKITYSVIKKLCSPSKEEMNRSFNIIFEKYRYLVYTVAYDILKNVEESKDIVNETFLKMYEKRANFTNEGDLKYYLLVIARNLSINRSKQLQYHLSYSDDMAGKSDDKDISLYLEKFKRVLDREEYKYLVLHIVYGFTFLEIAKANHLTISQVSSKYQRGIKKLRDYYGGNKR